jgi:hypothetical protein
MHQLKTNEDMKKFAEGGFKRAFIPTSEPYHLKMMISELEVMEPHGGDTRLYLSLDRGEREIMLRLLRAELEKQITIVV